MRLLKLFDAAASLPISKGEKVHKMMVNAKGEECELYAGAMACPALILATMTTGWIVRKAEWQKRWARHSADDGVDRLNEAASRIFYAWRSMKHDIVSWSRRCRQPRSHVHHVF
jgi:hypothetical protein